MIQRGGVNRQYYLICPAPLAAALELEKGEEIEWFLRDRWTFEIRRRRPEAATEALAGLQAGRSADQPEARVGETDPDARIMKQGDGGLCAGLQRPTVDTGE